MHTRLCPFTCHFYLTKTPTYIHPTCTSTHNYLNLHLQLHSLDTANIPTCMPFTHIHSAHNPTHLNTTKCTAPAHMQHSLTTTCTIPHIHSICTLLSLDALSRASICHLHIHLLPCLCYTHAYIYSHTKHTTSTHAYIQIHHLHMLAHPPTCSLIYTSNTHTHSHILMLAYIPTPYVCLYTYTSAHTNLAYVYSLTSPAYTSPIPCLHIPHTKLHACLPATHKQPHPYTPTPLTCVHPALVYPLVHPIR